MKRRHVLGSFAVALLLGSASASVSIAGQGDPVAGKATYEKVCAMCHGKTGKATVPPLLYSIPSRVITPMAIT